MKENVKKPIFRLTVSAVFIALSTVLSMLKIYEPPLGGGVTLFSMLPIIMLSCMFGIKWGLGVSFAYGVAESHTHCAHWWPDRCGFGVCGKGHDQRL